ncbi:MAG: M20/M25/M40 family metallo-hydrolase [Terriglobia bacterium]
MAEANRLMQFFFQLVRIDSLSFREKKVVQFLASKMEALGLETVVDGAGSAIDGDTGNLTAHLKGEAGLPRIIFSAHVDTVEPGRAVDPIVRGGVVKSAGSTILGADDKAGVAAILELAHNLVEEKVRTGDIFFVFTVAEEKGLLGAKHLQLEGLRADYAYVIDGDGPVGGIVLKAPSQNSLTALFRGKAAHAGVAPDDGVNAIQAAAFGISKLKLGRVAKSTTANIGVIRGGLAANIVPDETVVEGEVRSFSSAKLGSQTKQMSRLMKSGAAAAGAKVEVSVERAYDSFSFSRRDKIVKHVLSAFRNVGVEPRPFSSGGGSDANVLNKLGIPALNLSCGVKGAHTVEEHVAVDDMGTLSKVLPEIVRVAANRG